MEINIRRADVRRKTSDMIIISRFENAAALELSNGNPDVIPVNWYLNRLSCVCPPRGPLVGLLAEIQEDAVGHILYESTGDEGMLDSLYVLPTHRTKGVGSQLVDKAIKDLKQRDVRSLCVCSDPSAVRFYEKYGFIVTTAFGSKTSMTLSLDKV